jgi:hypothetical protein
MQNMDSAKLMDEGFKEILQTVAENPNIMNSDIKNKLNNKRSLTNKIQELVKSKMITEKKHGMNNKKTYTITQYGQTVLDNMINLEAAINKKPIKNKSENEDFISPSRSLQDQVKG